MRYNTVGIRFHSGVDTLNGGGIQIHVMMWIIV